MISSPMWSDMQHVRWQCLDRNTLTSVKLAGSYYSMDVKLRCWTSFGSYHASFWSEWITAVTDDWTGVYTAQLPNFFQRFTLQISCSKAQVMQHWKLSLDSFKKNKPNLVFCGSNKTVDGRICIFPGRNMSWYFILTLK